MIDLVSILFVRFLDLLSCMRKKHQHVESALEDEDKTSSKIYDIYHLRLCITDCWNHSLEFICFFLTVDCNVQNSQILLERLMLKDFKINICNSTDSWKFEFEHKSKMTEISSSKFAWEIISAACVFKVCTVYWSAASDDDLWKNEDNSDDLSNVSIQLHKRYQDFFNTHNTDWLVSH